MPEISSAAFSETDTSNNAAPPAGFPEGMNMSGLNDSGRAVMGAIKRFWGRMQGRYVSAGSANAYLLTPDVDLAAYVVGERYSFRANFANTGSATLDISALGACPLKKITISGKTDLSPGDIQAGQPVTVEYDGEDMIMVTPAATISYDATPTGMIAPFAGAAVPNGWLLCDGAAVSRTSYAALFAVISTTYGAGDGTTTFNLPDLRGRVAIGRDNMGGAAANRAQLTTTLSTTNGSSAATVASASNLSIGMAIISANVPAGTVITAISGTTITMSSGATATATGTTARFSLLTDAQSLGGSGGAQTHALVTAQMPAHTHTYNDIQSTGANTLAAGGNVGLSNTGTTGGNQPHPNIQPSIVLNYLIRT